MLPIQLTIEGIYSYQERQTIDFTQLTDAGLFGIFGSVGSGKSSILEAITYALYGETERLNSRDKRTYNMMNLKSNRSYIELEFKNHEDRLFKATREFKRNSKRFEDVNTPMANLYEWKNNAWIPLESTNVEPIIGLSYENFKRTIIIPQGQFKEFLELGEKDRTQMMMEIFNLHQYDLYDKVSALSSENKTKLNQLQGQLVGFETVSEEEIQAQKKQLTEAKKAFDSTKEEFDLKSERFQQLKTLKAEFETLQNKKKSLTEMESQQESINAEEKKLEEFERVQALFAQILETQNRANLEYHAKSEEEIRELETLKNLETQIQEVQQKLNEIQPQFEALELKKTEKNDWELILKIQEAKKEIDNLIFGSKKGLEYVEETKNSVQNLKTQIQELEEKIDSFGKEIIDSVILMEVEKWFLQTQNFQESKAKLLKSIQNKNENIQELNNQIKTLHKSTQSFEIKYTNKQNEIELKSKEIDNQRQLLLVQQQISNYAVELKDGEPCPLCGALDHPNIVQVENVSTQLEELQNQWNQLEAERKYWQNLKEQIDRIEQQKKFIQENLEKEIEELKNLELQISEHREKFHWKEFQADDFSGFEQIKKSNQQKQDQVKSWQAQLKELRSQTEEKSKLLEKAQHKLEEYKRRETAKQAEIQTNLSYLKSLKFEDYQSVSFEKIQAQIQNLEQSILDTEKNHQQFTKLFQELTPKLASQKTLVEGIQKRKAEIEIELKTINEKISENLSLSGLDSLEAVKTILSQNLDVAAIRQQIQNYRIELSTLRNSVKDLESKLTGKNLDEEEFAKEESLLKEVETRLQTVTETVGKLQAEISRLEVEFAKKAELLKEQTKLQKREENLKTLSNLFKGAGFVQYVSSIYLRQLCDNANIRFHRMTRNQLSLQLSEKGDFEIIDYLNEGRSRSVKTLSGGQAFQASLSLALALAESVQSQAKSEKNFFFIDEGFGTQDLESVNIVFETLTSLQKENRIVGIISHVEELQERIPMALRITKDEEKGSQITLIN